MGAADECEDAHGAHACSPRPMPSSPRATAAAWPSRLRRKRRRARRARQPCAILDISQCGLRPRLHAQWRFPAHVRASSMASIANGHVKHLVPFLARFLCFSIFLFSIFLLRVIYLPLYIFRSVQKNNYLSKYEIYMKRPHFGFMTYGNLGPLEDITQGWNAIFSLASRERERVWSLLLFTSFTRGTLNIR